MRMSKWMLAVVLTAVCGLPVYGEDAPAQPPATKPADGAAIAVTDGEAIKAKIGETVTIEGVVETAAWSKSGKVLNVSFKDVPQGLLLVVFEKNKDKFNGAFNGDAAAAWTGAKIKVTGKLAEYGGKDEKMKGRPQIVLQNPEQVTVVEAAAK